MPERGKLWQHLPRPTEGWSKMDWNALLISMELRAQADQNFTPILKRHCDFYLELLMQPEQAQQTWLTKEWAKVLASVSWEWLFSSNHVLARNQARIACKWCKEESTISLRITARAITPTGHLAAGPYRTWVKLDNGFLCQPAPDSPAEPRQAEHIRQALNQSLPIQTRDALFGIIHTRSVYSEQVPRVFPGGRERRMTAGGSIEWERRAFYPKQVCRTTTYREKKPQNLPQNQCPTQKHKANWEKAWPQHPTQKTNLRTNHQNSGPTGTRRSGRSYKAVESLLTV